MRSSSRAIPKSSGGVPALSDIIFGDRLGTYKYLDMDKVIGLALAVVREEFG